MNWLEKVKTDGAPIAFFGTVIAIKTYSLITYLGRKEDLWYLLKNMGSIDQEGPRATFYLTGELSYVLYFVTALAFDALVFYSFVIRGAAKHRPRGFWENWYPLLTVFVPVIGFTLLFIPAVRHFLPAYSAATLEALGNISPFYGFYMNLLGLTMGFAGAAFSIWAISHLKASFGLRTAVRRLVRSGPYARIRHPLYVGEIIHMLGIAILSGTPVGMYLIIVAVAMQIGRAKIEEYKFLSTIPEYREYKDSTGFLWPRLRKLAPPVG